MAGPSAPPSLSELSAKATSGTWTYRLHHYQGEVSMGWLVEPNNILPGVSMGGPNLAHDGPFIAALVNAYRAGELVPSTSSDTPLTGDKLALFDMVRAIRAKLARSPGMEEAPFSREGWALIEAAIVSHPGGSVPPGFMMVRLEDWLAAPQNNVATTGKEGK